MALLSFIIGIIGNVVSILMFASPIKTFRKIFKKKSTENYKGVPYITTLLSTSLWSYYGLLKSGGLLIVTVNGAGAALHVVYVTFYLIYAPNNIKVKYMKLVAAINIGFLGAVILVTQLAFHGSLRITLIGILCAGLTIGMYAAPLAAMILSSSLTLKKVLLSKKFSSQQIIQVLRMGDSQAKYNMWTNEESNELLKLMVDAVMRGWRDKNGTLNKRTVEKNILPVLNAKLGCEKTFTQYQSRLKWFKQQYNNYSNLTRNNSGFGWDPETKKFTATDEVWEEYFKSHPKHEHYRTSTFADYEDLRIVVGNGTATGKYSIGLGDGTDARTFETEENRGTSLLDDYVFDYDSGEFMQSDKQESSYQPPPPGDSTLPLPSQPISSEIPPSTRKRDRNEFE